MRTLRLKNDKSAIYIKKRDAIYMNGKRFAAAKTLRGMNNADLCDILRIRYDYKVIRATLSLYELGKRRTVPRVFVTYISEILDVPVDFLTEEGNATLEIKELREQGVR